MSIFSFIQENKLLALKIALITSVVATGGAIALLKPEFPQKQTSTQSEQDLVLGAETTEQEGKNPLSSFREKVEDLIDTSVKETKKTAEILADQAKNQAKNAVSDTTTKATETIKETVFQNTITTVIKEIEKLSPQQQEEIRNQLCK